MNRATLFYVVTVLGCAAGMWAVLAVGAGLSAPTDLSGEWLVTPGTSDASARDLLGRRVTVSQSGRFLHFEFGGNSDSDSDSDLVLDLKMVQEGKPSDQAGAFQIILAGGGYRMTIRGETGQGPLQTSLEQPGGEPPVSFRLDRPTADRRAV